MGDSLPGGRRSTQVLVVQPGGRGRSAEVLGVVNVGRGQDPADAIRNSGIPLRGNRLFAVESVAGGRITPGDVDGATIQDLGISNAQFRRGSVAANAAGIRSIANSDTFAQLGARTSAARTAAQAAGRANSATDFNRTRTRVLRQSRGQSRRQRQGALRRAGIPSRFLDRPVRASDVNRGRLS